MQKNFASDTRLNFLSVEYLLNINSQADLRNEKVGFKVREHTLRRVPYMLVCGDKEITEGKVSVRTRKGADLGTYKVEEFVEILKAQIRGREVKLLGEE